MLYSINSFIFENFDFNINYLHTSTESDICIVIVYLYIYNRIYYLGLDWEIWYLGCAGAHGHTRAPALPAGEGVGAARSDRKTGEFTISPRSCTS